MLKNLIILSLIYLLMAVIDYLFRYWYVFIAILAFILMLIIIKVHKPSKKSEIITMEKEPLNTPLDSLTRYPSQSTTIKYVLEMIGGWFEEHDINVGTIINLNQFSN